MTDTAPTSNKRDTYRQQIESVRGEFHQLLDSMSEEDFKKKSGNASWSNGQLLWHLGWGVGYIPQLVERSRKGKNLNLPRGVFNAINPWVTRWGSRGITPAKVAELYDAATAKALTELDTVQDGDWDRSATITGAVQSVEHHFETPAAHFAEHKADILKSLGR